MTLLYIMAQEDFMAKCNCCVSHFPVRVTLHIEGQDTMEFANADDAVLQLLAHCHPSFYDKLKIDYLGRYQRAANGIVPTAKPGDRPVTDIT